MFHYKCYHINTWPGLSLHNHTWERTIEFLKQSIPNIGTLLFQVLASQAITILIGRLGELSIATSSVLSTITNPWSGSLNATSSIISSVRVGIHLGCGNTYAAKKSTTIILYYITIINIIMTILFLSPLLRRYIINIATDDQDVINHVNVLIPAMLIGTYLNILVNNITSGVFAGQGRPIIATILSFGFELPLSIGGIVVYLLVMKGGNLLGVYWWQVISGGIEVILLFIILNRSDWDKCAKDIKRRQESNIVDVVESESDDEPLLHDTESAEQQEL